MRRQRLLAIVAAGAIAVGGLGLSGAPAAAQTDPADGAVTGGPGPGMVGGPGVPGPDQTTATGSVTDGPPVTPPDVLPDTPNTQNTTTATEIQNGSTGAAGTNAGADAPVASGE